MNKFKSVLSAALLGLTTVTTHIALAQENYPNKPITIVVPFAPGGNLDVSARIVTPEMSKILGQSIIIENKAGAGGAIGHQAIARANPDGYTLVTTANGSFTVTPRLQAGKRPFTANEFAPVGMIGVTPCVLEVPANSKFKNLQEFIKYAKENPGKVTVGHSGNGTTNHLAILLFEEAAGIKLNVIPYKGSAPALSDLLGNQIDAVVDQLPSSLNHLRGGKLKAIAITVPKRSPDLPDVPTLDESGFKGFDVATASGFLAPTNTPPHVIAKLNQALNQSLANKEVQERLLGLGSQPSPMTSQQFTDFLLREDANAEALFNRGTLKAE